MKQDEYLVQCAITEYLIVQYPNVEFRSDLGGIRLPMGLAIKAKRVNGGRRAWPDLFIAEPRWGYYGLFVEIKASREEVYGKKGNLLSNQHVAEQHQKLLSLRGRGYMAEFGMGFDHCVNIIDDYLRGV